MIKLPRASVQDCMGVAELGQRFSDAQTAMLAVRAAHKRVPNDLMLLLEVARIEHQSGHTKDAFRHLEKAEGLCRSAEDFDHLGNHWGRLEEAERSHAAFQKSYDLAPESSHMLTNLAVSHGFLGHTDEAEELYDQAIERGNKDELTYLNRSWLRKQTKDSNHIEELQTAIDQRSDKGEGTPFLLYALSKELEEAGEPNEAFDALERAMAARRKQIEFSSEEDSAEIDEIIETYGASCFENMPKGDPTEEPIFIVGLPRSGSTLVERIISSHSDVFAAGELQNFNRAVRLKTAEAAMQAGVTSLDPLAMSLQTDPREIGRTYLSSTRPRTGHCDRFIDKQPNNLIFCGLIARALPNARIIHTKRHPMDLCYAVMKQSFQDVHFFSYDQREMANRYIAYMKLMDHWDSVLPGRIISVQYEDLVQDTEGVTRNLIERLGLEWQDACLDFTANEQASMTASATQVRQPIYKTSVEKWRQYEDRLTVLKETLEAGGIDVAASETSAD